VGVDIIRKLAGMLEGDRDALTALVVTNSTFTRGAVRFASGLPAVDLIEGPALVLLLNKHLGLDWPNRIGRITGNLLARGAESPI
jgi:restriction system protein